MSEAEALFSVLRQSADKEVVAAIERLVRDGPDHALNRINALDFAAKEKLMMDQPRDKFRRAMIIISDGEDTESRMSRDQALEMAQKADVVVYAISTNIKREDSDGDKVLRYLTEETGGQAFFPFKIEDLDQSFENIANELRHQYNIFYRPEPLKADGLYHPVTVRTHNRKDLVVKALRLPQPAGAVQGRGPIQSPLDADRHLASARAPALPHLAEGSLDLAQLRGERVDCGLIRAHDHLVSPGRNRVTRAVTVRPPACLYVTTD